MSLEDDIKVVLREAGETLKKDLWKPEDEQFLLKRAQDLVRLQIKAHAATDPKKKAAYVAAASDTLNHVRLLAIIRMEVAVHHVADALGRFFLEKVLPELAKLTPALVGMVG